MSEIAFEKPAQDISAELPVEPLGWRVLIRPFEAPKKSAGGIELPDEARESEQLLTYVGQIVAMGNKCFEANTRTGIDMAEIEPRPKVGDWILFGTYGGQKIITKRGTKYLLMNDDGIMGIVKDPATFRAYL